MSLDPTLSVLPVGEAACLLELGETSPATTARARTLARAVLAAGWTGVYDAVPAYRTVLIRFDPEATDLSEIEPQIQQLNSMAVADIESEGSIIELPVLYGGELGPDLEDVALHTGLPPDEVVRRHASALYTVEFLGFSPGFPYLSGLPPELSIPRLAAPRSRVPAGAVAIAGHQTGFYPLASPGGWRLIGRIQSFTFDPARPETLPYRPGDRIRFVPIHDSTPASAGSSDAQLPSRDIDDALQQSPLRPPQSGIPSIDTPSVSPSPIGLDFGPARLGLRVVRAGLQCTIQDDGRYGLASLGYATAGALDRHALRLANRLVGNPPGSACIELAVDGGEFEAVSDCVIAVTGADLGPTIDGMPITTCRAAWLRTGMRLSFDRPRTGMRAYLAVAGGFATPIVLGSRSTDLLAGIGGLDGRALRAGDVLPLLRSVEHSTVGFTCERLAIPGHESEIVLRTVWGPQANWFDQHMRNLFTQATFVVSPRSDRTGLRLSGSAIQVTNTSDLASEGGVPGVVQIPPDGQPIILLADSRGVGGYPKLATVIGADLSRLAYAAPGMRVRFESTTVQDASIATRNAMAAIANTPLRPVPELVVRCLQESLAWPDERSWLCPRTFACAVSQRCSSGPIESEHDTQPG